MSLFTDKDIECPYCHHPQDICHDDGHGCWEADDWEDECEKCEKVFGFSTSISFYHEAYGVSCPNGGLHVWRKMSNYHFLRSAYWRERYRCEDCGKEKKIYENRKA